LRTNCESGPVQALPRPETDPNIPDFALYNEAIPQLDIDSFKTATGLTAIVQEVFDIRSDLGSTSSQACSGFVRVLMGEQRKTPKKSKKCVFNAGEDWEVGGRSDSRLPMQ